MVQESISPEYLDYIERQLFAQWSEVRLEALVAEKQQDYHRAGKNLLALARRRHIRGADELSANI